MTDNPGYRQLIPEWPLFHDTRDEAEQCPACNPQVPDAATSPSGGVGASP